MPIAFEFVEQFDYSKLTSCGINENVFSRPFVIRHGDFAFKWCLHVTPKLKRNGKEAFAFSLCWDDRYPGDLFADYDLFAGNNQDVNQLKMVVVSNKFCDGRWNVGPLDFLPSVASLKEKGLVVDDVVQMGVKIVLKALDFDPLRWLQLPSLTPNDKLVLQLFNNLNTDNDLGTDFVLVVGEAKKELRINRLALTVVPFFDRMFSNNAWKENQERALQLPMHTVDAVVEALRFIYLNTIGDDLTRFLPSVLALASEWELNDLMKGIERDMVTKLQADRLNVQYDIAAEYLELAAKYNREVIRRVAICKLINAWPHFIVSPKGKSMDTGLKDEITTMMSAAAICGGGVFV